MRDSLPSILSIACLVLAGVLVVPAGAAAPAVSSITPSSGSENGGTPVTITGAGFSAGASVCFLEGSWGGTCDGPDRATQVVVNSATSISVRTPARTVAGSVNVNVVVVNLDGQATVVTNGFQYQNAAAPTVTSLSPNSGSSNGGTLVTIRGTGFDLNARPTVKFGGVDGVAAPVVTVKDATTLSVVTPPKAGGAGSVGIVVSYVPGAGASSPFENGFLYVAAAQPGVTGTSPSTGGTNGGNRVTVSGSGFAPGATVKFGDAFGTQVIFSSTTSLSVVVPPRAAPEDGNPVAVTVRVTNPDEQFKDLLSGYSYLKSPAPTVDSILPTFGPRHGGEIITVNGEGFVAGTVLYCKSTSSENCGVAGQIKPVLTPDATTAFFAVPAGTPGLSTVFWLLNPDGQEVKLPPFSYRHAFVIASVSPASGSREGGDVVTLTGENFDCDGTTTPATVLFGTTPAFSVMVAPTATCTAGKTTTLTVVTPGRPAGEVAITVNNPSGLAAAFQKAFVFATTTAAPTVTGVVRTGSSPAAASGSANGNYDVTITGTNFACTGGPKPTVAFGTAVVAPEKVTLGACTDGKTTELTVKAPPRLPGSVTVSVVNPSGQSGSKSSAFTYNEAAPTITTVTPSEGSPNGGTTLNIVGTGFTCGDNGLPTVTFGTATGGTPAFSVTPGTTGCPDDKTTTTLTVVTPGRAAGSAPVLVRNPSGQSATSPFTFGPATAAPTIGSLSVTQGPSLGGASVTITGTGFGCPSTLTSGPLPTVTFGSRAVPAGDLTACSSTSLTVTTPPNPLGAVNVVVRNPSGQAVTLSNGFTYNVADPSPSLTGASPQRGTALGGTSLTITGTGFYCHADGAKPTVTLGGTAIPADGVKLGTCDTGRRTTELTITTPPRAAGVVAIVVINPDGLQGSAPGGFRFLSGLPTITSLSPASGSNLGGPLTTLAGTNYQVGATVLFTQGATTTAAQAAFVASGTQVLAATPAGTIGLADVTYVDPDGQSVTLAGGYTFTQAPAPTASSITPTQGTVQGGTTVTITGASFGPGAIVCFGPLDAEDACPEEQLAADVSVAATGTSLQAVTPPHSLGTVDVTVINPDGQPSNLLPQAFTFLGVDQLPVPTVASVTPSTGPADGGTVVTIRGTGFASPATVKFGTADATGVQVDNSTTIRATTPAHAAGTVDVVVTIAGQAVTRSAAFVYTAADSETTTTTTDGTETSGTGTGTGTGAPPTTIPSSDLTALNKRIQVTVTREGDANVIKWELPTSGLPGTVQGVQVWRSNSPYSLAQTFTSGSSAFTSRTFTDTGADAQATTKYLVTMFFGPTPALGLFTASTAPDTAVYPGTSSEDAADGAGLPTWAIVLIALGILFLVVLVAVLIARGRNREGQQGAAQGYAWEEEGQAQAAEDEWQGPGPAGEVHQARCPACSTSFTATGSKPIVTVCPGCGKKGILR